MATTDYDTPRPSSVEDPDTDPLDAISTARKEAQSPNVDLDETDTADGIELPGADCASCFLVQHRSRLAAAAGGQTICVDCV